MRVAKFGRVQLITAVCLLVVFHLTTIVATAEIEGEYLEARSVDVYTGACHFGSDYVEGGREATLVWKIESGTWNNVSLSGLTIVAVVSADQNLDLDQNTRRSVLYLDPQVTPAQQQVVVDLMQTKRSAVVGQVVAVKKVEINFRKTKPELQTPGRPDLSTGCLSLPLLRMHPATPDLVPPTGENRPTDPRQIRNLSLSR